MNERSKRYYRNKFCTWKYRVYLKLDDVVLKLYSLKKNDDISITNEVRDIERALGFVIEAISNPMYAILSESGKRIPDEERLPYQVLLELQVEKVFNFVNTITNKI